MKVKRGKLARVAQGDILKNVDHIEYASEKSGVIEVSKISFPLVIVLTQDCDLLQDYRARWAHMNKPKDQDKWLLSVIVAPIYNVEHFYTGEHLSRLGQKMQEINRKKTQGQTLRNNETPRYHYIEFPEISGLPPSVIDFKHYFSVDSAYLKRHKKDYFICQIKEVYREDIAQRFSAFLSRIALP